MKFLAHALLVVEFPVDCVEDIDAMEKRCVGALEAELGDEGKVIPTTESVDVLLDVAESLTEMRASVERRSRLN